MNSNQDAKNWLYISLSIVVVIAVLAYQTVFVIVPYVSTELAKKVPPSIVEFLDEMTLEGLDEEGFSPSDIPKETQDRLRHLFSSLVAENAQSGRAYQLVFRAWDGIANAMALPNGTIVLTDRLIELAANDEQIAAVLLHEIAHVEENHGLEGLIKSSLLSVSLSALFGDVGAMGEILVQGAVFGTDLKYSRDAELEADAFAVNALLQGSKDPMSLEEILSSISGDADNDQMGSTWLSSHPDLPQRIEQIRQIKLAM
ncbi:MAG: M48 family metallopeptidase [Glaciecola sp.]